MRLKQTRSRNQMQQYIESIQQYRSISKQKLQQISSQIDSVHNSTPVKLKNLNDKFNTDITKICTYSLKLTDQQFLKYLELDIVPIVSMMITKLGTPGTSSQKIMHRLKIANKIQDLLTIKDYDKEAVILHLLFKKKLDVLQSIKAQYILKDLDLSSVSFRFESSLLEYIFLNRCYDFYIYLHNHNLISNQMVDKLKTAIR